MGAVLAGAALVAAAPAGAAVPFSAPFRFYGGATPTEVAVADFNSDGRPDIVTSDSNCSSGTNCGAPSVWVRLGGPFGTFGPAVPYPVPGSAGLVTGNFGSGLESVAVLDGSRNTVGILPGTGLGAFGVPYRLSTTNAFLEALASADLNGDGVDDLIGIDNYGSVVVWLSDGHGGFGAPQTHLISVSPSIAISNGLVYTTSLATSDVDRDGHPDIVVAGNYNGTDGSSHTIITVLLSDGHGDLTRQDTDLGPSQLGGYRHIAIGDVNGDGNPDIVGANYEGVYTLLGDGHGNFAQASVLHPADPVTGPVALSDFDGDGHLDLAAADEGANLTLLRGDGTGQFSLDESATPGGDPLSLATADFLGDGRSDLAIVGARYSGGRHSYESSGHVAIFYNLTPPSWWPAGASWAWPSVLAQWASGAWPSSLRPWDINAWLPQPPIPAWQSLPTPVAGIASIHHSSAHTSHRAGPVVLQRAGRRRLPRWLTPRTVSRWAAAAHRREHAPARTRSRRPLRRDARSGATT
jgi:hypothetical protein